jgi:hypothetical protein
MLLNGPSKRTGERETKGERDLQNIYLMCYIHAKREKAFHGKYVFWLLQSNIFMRAERKIVQFMLSLLGTKPANNLISTHFLSVQQQSLVSMVLLEVEFLKVVIKCNDMREVN